MSRLTLNEMKAMAKNKDYIIFVLYADWCGHCDTMKKTLYKKGKLNNTDHLYFIEEKEIDDSLKDYFPHIYYFENGNRGKDMSLDELYDYLK